MNAFKWSAAVAATWIVGGCAASLEQPGPQSETAAAARTSEGANAPAQGSGDVRPNLVVDVKPEPPGSEIRCREMLRPGSNVIVARCATVADWEEFERRQEEAAEALVRRLQGSSFGGPYY